MGASKRGYVAFDLGAESGRAMLATFDGRRIELGEQHRFANRTIRLPDGLHWDLTGLWAHLLEGLSKSVRTAADQGVTIVSLGVDTWGVDYGLIGQSGQLLGLPFAYRDDRNPPAMAATLKKLGEKRIYDVTGIQFMPFNTLYQLVAQQQSEPALLEHAKHILAMPDLLQYFFSGQAVNEATDASTTQMIDPRPKNGAWAKDLIAAAGVPTHFLGDLVPAGTKIGHVLPGVAAETGCPPQVAVIAPGTHDTASAVAAVPAETGKGNWAYLSSGTWSLMGAEIDEPAISPATLTAQFTHERGVGGKIRFLKNIAGLWLVQECRRDLEKHGQSLDYAALTAMAAKSLPFRTLLDPDHAPFGTPGDMLAKIRDFARKTAQPEPTEPGQFVRCCLESLALRYRQVMDLLEQLLGRQFERLHIVGGGGKNTLLNQMTADALGRPVIVGPYEATAIGNALTQAMGAGQIQDLAQLRQVVRDSFDLTTVEPKNSAAFANHLERFAKLRLA